MIKKTLILLLIPLSVLSQPNFFGTHREGNIPDTIPVGIRFGSYK